MPATRAIRRCVELSITHPLRSSSYLGFLYLAAQSGPPVSFRRNVGNRDHTPSNPASPSASYDDSTFSPSSRRPSSRPHSRTRSAPNNAAFNNPFDTGYASPEDTVKRPLSRYGMFDDSFDNAVSSLPMPRTGSDSDEEDMDLGLGLVMDRSKTNSTVSMEATERLEALQRANEDLSRKCIESENALQNKMDDHDAELAEIHAKLDELRNELTASNREEKELRAKDVSPL